MLKIRRPLGRLIFNMRIAIPGKTVFLIETAPSSCVLFWLNEINNILLSYNELFLLLVNFMIWFDLFQ